MSGVRILEAEHIVQTPLRRWERVGEVQAETAKARGPDRDEEGRHGLDAAAQVLDPLPDQVLAWVTSVHSAIVGRRPT